MPIMNSEALTEARQKKGWTQKDLSEATSRPQIAVSTISRLERGKSLRVRETTLRQLARVLGVRGEDLCPRKEIRPDVVKLKLGVAARNALSLVALRYRIHRDHIVEVAPLLFFLAAEQSLQVRKKRLAQVRDAEATLFDIQRQIQHLPPRLPGDPAALSAEQKSIEARDLFGAEVFKNAPRFQRSFGDDFDEATHNPFAVFLRAALEAVGASAEEVEAVQWDGEWFPNYQICTEQAELVVGRDEEAVLAILTGFAALHEMPKGSPEERAEWARVQQDKLRSRLDEIDGEMVDAAPESEEFEL